jgi:hypothetical protein
MIDSLRSVRLSRLHIAAVAIVSTLASALIITSALGRSAAQSAALATLKHRRIEASPAIAASGSQDTSAALPSAYAPVPSGPTSSSATSQKTSSSPAGASNVGAGGTAPAPSTTSSARSTHKVGHVFVIALSTPSFDAVWGASSRAKYLNHALKPAGTFLGGYETLSTAELPDYLAIVSGQAPNADTEAGCATYSEFAAGVSPAANGQVAGAGCVYPNTIITIADQVTASGHGWKGYIDDLTPSSCVHPNSGALDDVQLPGAGAQYVTRHNPFIYFHSLLDLGGCASDDVSLTELPHDLRSLRSTPRYSFIAPGGCDEGSAQSCPSGGPVGLAGEDAFLRQCVPAIERSAAYKRDGVIMIVFALSGGLAGGGPTPTGALLISRFAKRGKRLSTVYNPYSVLRGTEELFGYQLLGHAKTAKSYIAAALPGA